MTRSFFLLPLVLAVAFGPASGQVQDKKDLQTLTAGNSEFAFAMYARLSKQDGNVVFSPYSISTTMGMLSGGASGETAKQLAKVLHFALPNERLHPAFAQLAADLQKDFKDRPYEIYVANALWAQKGFPIGPDFPQLISKNYAGGLKEVDFSLRSEEARKTINRWVEDQTRDKIKELLQPGTLAPGTRLVVTNALYFKGTWQTQFPKELTKNTPFAVSPKKNVMVPMMSIPSDMFKYCEEDNCQWLELPYKGSRFSLVIVLPKKKGSLASVEQTLTPVSVQRALAKLQYRWGPVALPRFKATKAYSILGHLKALGLKEADFCGMILDNVLHKAFIDVDELGTEAAAATGAILGIGFVDPFSFRADHPFLFLLRDQVSGAILFMGRVIDPSV